MKDKPFRKDESSDLLNDVHPAIAAVSATPCQGSQYRRTSGTPLSPPKSFPQILKRDALDGAWADEAGPCLTASIRSFRSA